MAVALEQFVKQLEESGILAGDTIKDFIPPKASPRGVEELARELVRKKKLTRFQAEETCKGKAKSLVLGNYILMEKIGAGGMGQVFKARHRRMDRIVAVKLLPAAMTKDQATIARFEREVKAAAKISHPNIVSAYDADCANGVHFLVMEFVEGSDLSILVKKNGPLPVDKAVHCILQAAKGLEAAHKKGIVHRDIKPANLLLDKEGTVKILDMGLARVTGDHEAPTEAELTSSGTVMGTVDYMAPEQALSAKTADARADIYALGCTLYYLLMGKATYGGETLMAKLLAHREHPIPSLRATCPDVPEAVEEVFPKLVAKRVQDRYQTVTEVIAALVRCESYQDRGIATQQLLGTISDTGRSSFLKDIFVTPLKAVAAKKVAKSLIGKGQKKWLIVGGGLLGVLLLLAAYIAKLKPKDVAPIVTVNEPNAEIQVLHAEGKVEMTRPLAYTTPGFDRWVKKVAALPAEQQIAAVSNKLVELNSGFDGKVKGWGSDEVKIENGVVTQFGFFTDHVTDISPVQALTGLQYLYCDSIGQPNSSAFVDLSPLRGMQLMGLSLTATNVSDLSALKGMPLIILDIASTRVVDLSPLSGLRLYSLSIGRTQVADLTPLHDMRLAAISCPATKVNNLFLLKAMPLIYINLDFEPERDTELLRSIKTLERINGKPAAEFWKVVESQN